MDEVSPAAQNNFSPGGELFQRLLNPRPVGGGRDLQRRCEAGQWNEEEQEKNIGGQWHSEGAVPRIDVCTFYLSIFQDAFMAFLLEQQHGYASFFHLLPG